MPAEQWWWFWSKVCWVLAGCLGLSLVLSLATLLAGCNTGTPPTPPLPPATPTKAVTVQEPPVKPAAEPASKSQGSEGQDGEPREGEAGREGEAPAEAESGTGDLPSEPVEPPPPTFATERVLLLVPRNPLIVEFQLSIDGRPHTQAMDRLVEEVLKLADTDADGRPTWKEVVASQRFKYGQFGNLPIAGENEYKQIIDRYDVDRDGAVDAGELPRFLTRNAGSARPFSVRGTADYRHGRGRGSPLWRLLDADDDGSISADERAAASSRMATRDTDDDEILLAGDLNPRVQLDPGMMNERRRVGPTIIRLLGTFTNWDAVRLSMEEHYAGGGYLQSDSFPLTPELFPQLDANQDGRLVKAEYVGLNKVAPHLVVAVRFGKPEPEVEPAKEGEAAREGEAPAEPTSASETTPAEPKAPDETTPTEPKETDKAAPTEPPADQAQPAPPAEPPPPPLAIVSIIPALADSQHSTIEQTGRITFRVAGTVITLYLNDTVEGGDFAAQAQQALTALDGDKNGYLEKSEVPQNAAPQLGQYEAVDTDENGKVYLEEIVAFLKQQQAGLRAQIHARASDREDALFAALDQNYDERLDAREVEEAPERLAQLDTSGDGLVRGDEIPESLTVGLARGNLENMDALFVMPPLVVRAPAEDTPRWFTAMDANGDGAISRREFLGSAEKFAPLDTSGDGLIDAVEAKAASK
jgi:Ca2+-binding EF-hand superfamily protein